MAIEKELLDQLLAGRDPKDVFNKDGLVDELKKALSERILNTELDEHLDADGVEGKPNHRNGYSKKSVLTGTSKMTLSVPRDRAGTFDPKLIAKYQRRFPVLGIWIEQTEGAKFWLRVVNELKTRGAQDILIAVVDGLKGFPEAINAVFPQTIVQTCIVHLIRHSMDFASWKDRKSLAQALRTVYRAADAAAGQAALDAFAQGPWGAKYPAIAQSWRRNWELVIPFFAFPEGVRRIIYTTNAIEALNSKLRRAVRTRGHFPSDDAATKLLYLVLNRATAEWKRPPREWAEAKTQFAVMFNEQFVNS